MAMQSISYQDARPRMQAGDVIAFGGKSHFSEIIKMSTRAEVSHVGSVLQTQVRDGGDERFFNQVIESTELHGFSGVQVSRLSDRLTYEGEIWWLPLRGEVRQNRFDQVAFYDFLFNEAKERTVYDMPQAIGCALDALDSLPFGVEGPTYNREDFSKFFCSELVAAGLEVAGSVGQINASEVTPIDLCRWSIYEPDYYMLKGDPEKSISRHNTMDPGLWNL